MGKLCCFCRNGSFAPPVEPPLHPSTCNQIQGVCLERGAVCAILHEAWESFVVVVEMDRLRRPWNHHSIHPLVIRSEEPALKGGCGCHCARGMGKLSCCCHNGSFASPVEPPLHPNTCNQIRAACLERAVGAIVHEPWESCVVVVATDRLRWNHHSIHPLVIKSEEPAL